MPRQNPQKPESIEPVEKRLNNLDYFKKDVKFDSSLEGVDILRILDGVGGEEEDLILSEKVLKGVNNTPCWVDLPVWVWLHPSGEKRLVFGHALVEVMLKLDSNHELRLTVADRITNGQGQKFLDEIVAKEGQLPFSFLVQELNWQDQEEMLKDWSWRYEKSRWVESTPAQTAFFKGWKSLKWSDSKDTLSVNIRFAHFVQWVQKQYGVEGSHRLLRGDSAEVKRLAKAWTRMQEDGGLDKRLFYKIVTSSSMM